MHRDEKWQPGLFPFGALEERMSKNRSLLPVRAMTEMALEALSRRFDELYSDKTRPSIPPEQLLRTLLLHAL